MIKSTQFIKDNSLTALTRNGCQHKSHCRPDPQGDLRSSWGPLPGGICRSSEDKSFPRAAPNGGATLLKKSLCVLGLHPKDQAVGTGCRSPTETNRMQ